MVSFNTSTYLNKAIWKPYISAYPGKCEDHGLHWRQVNGVNELDECHMSLG